MATVTKHTPSTHPQPCPCGCAPCPDECCDLECLYRPTFFCGQLLTDQDLDALVEWADRKHRLARHRHGWGVVCGLRVRPDPENPSGVEITPGYALDCCGRDLIACKPVTRDLTSQCAPAAGPCGVPGDDGEEQDDKRAAGASASGAELTGPLWSSDLDDETKFSYHDVDVLVRHAEKPSRLQAALERGACTETVGCEPTRAEEGIEAWAESASAAFDRDAAITQRWLDAYDETLTIVQRFCRAFPLLCGSDGAVDVPEQVGRDVCVWLMEQLDEQPLEHFPAVRDRIRQIPRSALTRQDVLVEILFWIVQDRRNSLVLCGCEGCSTTTGVPLARVRLRQWNDKSGERHCDVAWVSTHSPHRRELRDDCFPAYGGEINLARVLWRSPGEACKALTDLGLRVSPSVETLVLPAGVRDLETALTCRPFASCADEVFLQVIDSPLGGRRVVGFCGSRANGDRAVSEPAEEPATKRRSSAARKPRGTRERA
jgi:hypothetical protein